MCGLSVLARSMLTTGQISKEEGLEKIRSNVCPLTRVGSVTVCDKPYSERRSERSLLDLF